MTRVLVSRPVFAAAAIVVLLLMAAVRPANGATKPDAATAKADAPARAEDGKPSLDAERLFAAIVKVNTKAVPNARSAATLGREREGTGTVIGPNGLVLTIGYLIVEADEVSITDSKGRTHAARVVGYDHATGFGLVRPIVPINVAPVKFGNSGALAERDPVMIVSSGDDNASFVWVVSKRPFAGNWEYMLDQAIWTSPPTLNWSGAALVDRDGALVGVGSLIVRDATNDDPRLPGNLFVPIDVLKPILAELVKNGRRAGPVRPWLGLAADEVQGRLMVSRVSPDGPADQAGIKPGDIVLGVGGEGVRTQAAFYHKVWDRNAAGDVIALRVLQGVDVKEIRVRSIDRIEYFRPQTTH